jgi:hypothetical protein
VSQYIVYYIVPRGDKWTSPPTGARGDKWTSPPTGARGDKWTSPPTGAGRCCDAGQQLLQVPDSRYCTASSPGLSVLYLPRVTTSAVSASQAVWNRLSCCDGSGNREYPPNCGGYVFLVSRHHPLARLDGCNHHLLPVASPPPRHAWTHDPSPQHTSPKPRRHLPRLHSR